MRELARALARAANTATGTRHGSSVPAYGIAEVKAFVSERCDRSARGRETARDLLAAYTEWARVSGAPPLTQRVFGRAMSGLGFARRKSGRIIYCGLWLRTASSALRKQRSRIGSLPPILPPSQSDLLNHAAKPLNEEGLGG